MGSVYSTSNHFIWYKISHSHIEFDLFLLCHDASRAILNTLLLDSLFENESLFCKFFKQFGDPTSSEGSFIPFLIQWIIQLPIQSILLELVFPRCGRQLFQGISVFNDTSCLHSY